MPKNNKKNKKPARAMLKPRRTVAKKAHAVAKSKASKKPVKKSMIRHNPKIHVTKNKPIRHGVAKKLLPDARKHVESPKERREREAAVVFEARRKSDIKVVEEVFEDPYFSEHMTANVGESSVEVIKMLYKKPQTDEKLTEKLNMKINEVRRILNIMNGHGITKYDVTKDNSGWLIFTWRVDAEKLAEYAAAHNRVDEPAASLPENCNDFFFCKKCYDNNKIIMPFDSAIEQSFKCVECGSKLEMTDRENAELFMKGLKNVR